MKAFRLALLCISFAATCAFLRWAQRTVSIPAEAVQFARVHDIHWDEADRLLTRTGSDPFFIVDLPPVAKPIRHIQFDFIGAYADAEGAFYLFPFLGPPPNPTIGPMVHPQSAAGGGSFSISASLDNASGVRLDLPDFLPRSIELRRIVVETPFLHAGSILVKLTFGSLAAAILFAAISLSSARRRE